MNDDLLNFCASVVEDNPQKVKNLTEQLRDIRIW